MRRLTDLVAAAWDDLARPGWKFWTELVLVLAAEGALVFLVAKVLGR